MKINYVTRDVSNKGKIRCPHCHKKLYGDIRMVPKKIMSVAQIQEFLNHVGAVNVKFKKLA